jgi:hypothetical protein
VIQNHAGDEPKEIQDGILVKHKGTFQCHCYTEMVKQHVLELMKEHMRAGVMRLEMEYVNAGMMEFEMSKLISLSM